MSRLNNSVTYGKECVDTKVGVKPDTKSSSITIDVSGDKGGDNNDPDLFPSRQHANIKEIIHSSDNKRGVNTTDKPGQVPDGGLEGANSVWGEDPTIMYIYTDTPDDGSINNLDFKEAAPRLWEVEQLDHQTAEEKLPYVFI